jgi:hypothetical protein
MTVRVDGAAQSKLQKKDRQKGVFGYIVRVEFCDVFAIYTIDRS